MAIPWQAHTRKEIDGITHHGRLRKGHSFVPPAPRKRVDFSHAQLCASMAMTNALSGLSAAASGSLAQAMSQLVTDHVDDQKPQDLQFLSSVSHLADSARTFFSSCIATGVADQYALALGFRFRCNSREVIPRGKTGDFLYDGPPVPAHSAVMIESKGSLRANLNVSAFHGIVNQGYTDQVKPHVGNSYPLPTGGSLKVVHGYAIGCAAQVPLANAIGHVVETASSSGQPPRTLKLQSKPSLSGNGHGSNARIALGNYLGVATLIGDESLQRAIEGALQGQPLKKSARPEEIRVIRWRGTEFLLFDDVEIGGRRRDDDNDGYLRRMPRPRFAIWASIYRALYGYLRELPDEWRVPEVPAALTSGEIEDGGAVLPDGCALLPPWYEREAESNSAPRTMPAAPAKLDSPWDIFKELEKQRDEKAGLGEARSNLLITKLTE